MSIKKLKSVALAGAAGLIMMATAASAASIKITVTNLQESGGLSITPLYTALHNGSFDAFDVGAPASAGLELIAETGMASGIAAQRLATDPNSAGAVIASPAGPPPIQPGESASTRINVDPTGPLFFTFLSMLLPSNDHFIGNDDALAYQVFGSSGEFLGDQSITVTGNQIYDAGTEANGLTGSAFVAGQDISLSPADSSPRITQGLFDLSVFAGQTLATGDVLGSAAQIDFLTNPGAFELVRIEIAQVPLPASAPLLLAALGAIGFASRMRKKKT